MFHVRLSISRCQKIFILLIFLLLCNQLSAKGFGLNYDIVGAGEGRPGYYIVEVSSFLVKKKQINKDITKKCALHGVLFKGYAGKNGIVSKPALISDLSLLDKYENYFEDLVNERYGVYTTLVSDYIQVVKVDKKYKVTTIVQVNIGQLRKDLEREGIIRSLGF